MFQANDADAGPLHAPRWFSSAAHRTTVAHVRHPAVEALDQSGRFAVGKSRFSHATSTNGASTSAPIDHHFRDMRFPSSGADNVMPRKWEASTRRNREGRAMMR